MVQNSQCSINAAATSVRQGGNFFNFAFTVTATPVFGGPQTVFGYAADSGARNSGWRALGTWNAALGLNPKADSVAPNAITGNAESFTFSYSSSSGFANLGYVWVLIGSNLSLANACYVLYYPGPNTIYLAANDGFSTIGGVMPGFSGTLENSQCVITGAGTSVTGAGSTLTLTLAVAAKAPFDGTRNLFGYAADTAGLTSGWQALGTWVVTGP